VRISRIRLTDGRSSGMRGLTDNDRAQQLIETVFGNEAGGAAKTSTERTTIDPPPTPTAPSRRSVTAANAREESTRLNW